MSVMLQIFGKTQKPEKNLDFLEGYTKINWSRLALSVLFKTHPLKEIFKIFQLKLFPKICYMTEIDKINRLIMT